MKNIIKSQASLNHSVIVDSFRLDCFVFYVTEKRSGLKSWFMPDKIVSEPYVRILRDDDLEPHTSVGFELFIHNKLFRASSKEVGINNFSMQDEIEECYEWYLEKVSIHSKLTKKIQSAISL